MDTKRQKSFNDFKVLLADLEVGPECSTPNCQNSHRAQILIESITITNLIVAGELPPEMTQAIAARMAA